MPETHVVEITTYTLAELKALDGSGYQRALEWLCNVALDYDWYDIALSEISEMFEACGISYKHDEVEFDLGRGSQFLLPLKTSVDEKAFLKAIKIWLSGVDVRVALLDYGDTEGNARTAVRATGRTIRNLDLRSKDARIIREQGLVILRHSWFRNESTREFDLDQYHYEGLSDQFKEDANEFLADLCDSAHTTLREEMEYLSGEEHLTELAEANEYTFTEDGRIYA